MYLAVCTIMLYRNKLLSLENVPGFTTRGELSLVHLNINSVEVVELVLTTCTKCH